LIAILLATFNGEKYISRQLDSISQQTHRDWCLIACDDVSTDKTLSELDMFQKKYKGKVFLYENQKKLGVKGNFQKLLNIAKTDYVMLCDQDDEWEPNKITIALERMQQEEKNNPGLPILIHSDLRVVNRHGEVISESMFEYQRLPKFQNELSASLIKNNVTGCTVMLNRAAIDIATPIPNAAIMHDWWIASRVLQEGGIISFIDLPLVNYRQHESNTIGARKTSFLLCARKMVSLKAAFGSYYNVRQQAKAMGVSIELPEFAWIKLRTLFKK